MVSRRAGARSPSPRGRHRLSRVGARRLLAALPLLAVVLQAAGRLLIDDDCAARPVAVVSASPCGAAPVASGNQTRVILFAVGLGAFFVVGVRSLQASLLAGISACRSLTDSPDMFLIDIQRDQVERRACVPRGSCEWLQSMLG